MTDETVVYYTDSTPPISYTGSLLTAIPGFSSGDDPLVQYALYEDKTTYDAWASWAEQNAFNNEALEKFGDGVAFQVVGHWPTMFADTSEDADPSNATKSFMCYTSASKGGVCMEAEIGDSENTVTTWKLTDAQVESKLTAPFAAYSYEASPNGTIGPTDTLDQAVIDYVFFDTDMSGDATEDIFATVEDPATPEFFLSFGVANCSLTTIKMDCINWVVKETKAVDGVDTHYKGGDSVTFWWFDARYLD